MRVLVVGAGSVGGYFGMRLAQAGHEVFLVARGEHAAAIRAHGLVIETPEGELSLRAPVLEPLEQAWGIGAEVVLVGVKARDLSPVAAGLAPVLAPQGLVVSLLNGLDSERELGRAVGDDRVLGGKLMVAAGRLGPGRLYVRAGGSMLLAPLLPSSLPRAQELARVFALAFPCELVASLDWVLYRKLLWNVPFSALCAITGRSAGEVLCSPELEALCRAAMAEVIEVAQARGVGLESAQIEAMIEATRGTFAPTTSSMLEDLLAGRPTEAPFIQGALVREGERCGVDTPVTRTLLRLVVGLESLRTACRPAGVA